MTKESSKFYRIARNIKSVFERQSRINDDSDFYTGSLPEQYHFPERGPVAEHEVFPGPKPKLPLDIPRVIDPILLTNEKAIIQLTMEELRSRNSLIDPDEHPNTFHFFSSEAQITENGEPNTGIVAVFPEQIEDGTRIMALEVTRDSTMLHIVGIMPIISRKSTAAD